MQGPQPGFRGGAGESAELLDEVGLVVEPLFQGGLEGSGAPLQKVHDVLEARQTGESLGAYAYPLPEFPFHLPLAQAQLPGQRGQVQRGLRLQQAGRFAEGSIGNAGAPQAQEEAFHQADAFGVIAAFGQTIFHLAEQGRSQKRG